MKISGIRIPADGEQPIERVELERGNIGQYQEIVGGCFGVIDVNDPPASLFFNDEWLNIQLPLNARATALLYAAAPEHIGYNALGGDVLVLGHPDRRGDTTSAPDGLYDKLVRATA